MNGKSAIFTPLYLVNTFGKNEKSSVGFGLGAAPRAQIRGLFVFTKGVIEIISILGRDCKEIRGSLIGISSHIGRAPVAPQPGSELEVSIWGRA